MCGIAGIFHPDQRPIDRDALVRMTRSLIHRGPDEEGFHVEAGLGFGHRRLSIIDLSSGQQPMCNEDGTIWITFNGEIFNYVELREDLIKRGHQFRTRSDTETIVHLYEEHGLDFVDHLNGQFSLAIWDSKRRRLILVRDRVGIRPLFHATLTDGTVIFASEVKALFTHGALQPAIDPVAVGQISSLWVTVPPRTVFKGVKELPAGRMLVIENGSERMHRYWQHQFPGADEYEEHDESYWRERVREALFESVTLQLRADVPVATYLSGGLDSSIISALVKRHHNNDLITFSLGFDDAAFDERQFQREMVEYLSTDHREIVVNAKDVGTSFADVVWFAERPMMRTAPAPLLGLAGLVRENGIKVVLTGEGADEVFGGYNIFREDKVRRFWARQPNSRWRPALLSGLYGYVQRDERAEAFWRQFFRGELEKTEDPYYSHRIRWNNTSQMRRMFCPDFRSQMQGDEAMLAELEAYLEPDRGRWAPLCRSQYLEMTLFMSCYLLNAQGDRMMMGNSVEGRVPFLDHHVIELAAKIPPKFKLRGLEEKYVLKKAFEDLLPKSISQRPKKPYRAPIAASFLPGNNNLASELMAPDQLAQFGFVEPAACERLIKKAGTAALSERDEMAVATIASLQLLQHQFVSHPRVSSRGL